MQARENLAAAHRASPEGQLQVPSGTLGVELDVSLKELVESAVVSGHNHPARRNRQ
jgi:hypothetical protein